MLESFRAPWHTEKKLLKKVWEVWGISPRQNRINTFFLHYFRKLTENFYTWCVIVFKKLIFLFKNKLFSEMFDQMPLKKNIVLLKCIIRNLFCSTGLVFLVGVLMLLQYCWCYVIILMKMAIILLRNRPLQCHAHGTRARNEKKLQSSFTTLNVN